MVADMTPLGRYAQPEDIAGAVLMLAQNEASFATGNVLTVDGGLRIRPDMNLLLGRSVDPQTFPTHG